ncbi:oligosaccharide flippase family protein [Pseudomonas sp. 7-41]|uniref:oligosaccharide flippase family protein n=1 Tax=Pseudomonas sp. 7-41 TaxID=2898483 RepID=UPI001E639F05|nr:oligosaccharide flippase family protein [Pseudomonas sp. 7-41]UHG99697.1 oligosaccharide flippase family protein [Pseudomonas sp. 7-41]
MSNTYNSEYFLMRLILKSDYWRSIASVLTGSAIAQIIPILGALVIARLYSPGEFGVFASWLGGVVFLGVLVTGRFETALAIEQDGEPRGHAAYAVLVTSLMVAFGLMFAILVLSYAFPAITQSISTTLLLCAVPTALTIGVLQTWQSWAAAEGNYGQLSRMRICSASAITLLQIGLGWIQPSATTLGVGYFLGGLIACGIAMKLIPLRVPGQDATKVKKIKEFWSRQRRFPQFSLPADAINSAAAQLPIIIVAHRYGAEVAGLLAMTLRILGAPLGLLGKSVLDVFKRHAASHYRQYGECSDMYIRTLKVLSVGSLIFVVAMLFLSESLFVVFFGEKWRFSGTIATWMLPYFALAFIASPLSYMVYIAGKQNLDLMWQLALLAMTVTALSVFQNYATALKIYSAGYAALYFVYIAMSYHFSLGEKR